MCAKAEINMGYPGDRGCRIKIRLGNIKKGTIIREFRESVDGICIFVNDLFL
jgi:hypothetical protein